MAFDGKKFKKERYPKLAKIYKSCALPDLRGKFIRGFGGNSAALLEVQGDAIRNITGGLNTNTALSHETWEGWKPGSDDHGALRWIHGDTETSVGDGHWVSTSDFSQIYTNSDFDFDASRVVPTANENRPENVAFQYICWSGEYYV